MNTPLRDPELTLKKPFRVLIHSEPHHLASDDLRHVYFLKLFKRDPLIGRTVVAQRIRGFELSAFLD